VLLALVVITSLGNFSRRSAAGISSSFLLAATDAAAPAGVPAPSGASAPAAPAPPAGSAIDSSKTTPVDPAGAVTALDSQPLHRDSSASPPPAATDSSNTSKPMAFDPTRVIVAMVAVIGLIVLLRWGAKKVFPGAAMSRSTRAMKVVSRCAIAPRQQLLLIQVGKRLVMAADSAAGINPLCEITDGEEVSGILAAVSEENISAAQRFDMMFGKAKKSFFKKSNPEENIEPSEINAAADSVTTTEDAPPIDQPSQEADSIAQNERVDRVELSETFDPTHEVNVPVVDDTRKELEGLSKKVRALAQQLGNQ
jgi:flagellar biogenesis protein FliO